MGGRRETGSESARHLDRSALGGCVFLVAAVVGGPYAVVDGAVGGALIAWLYNKANAAPAAS
jgi:hypothetical protein